jgi:hypothetical protein
MAIGRHMISGENTAGNALVGVLVCVVIAVAP